MDRVAVYNVDMPHKFDSLVVVDITSESFPIYGEQKAEDIGISYTKPVFLARFKRVLHDGTIGNVRDCVKYNLVKGDQVVLFPDETISVITEGKYYSFSKINGIELLNESDFPVDFIKDKVDSDIMTEEELVDYINSFKFKGRSFSKPNSSESFLLDDDDYYDDEDNDLSQELSF